jgi:hypothetical protein
MNKYTFCERSYFEVILPVFANPAVFALLKNLWPLFNWQLNNEKLQDLMIPVILCYRQWHTVIYSVYYSDEIFTKDSSLEQYK